ncbi:MAG TPA: 30S ribosomal protein S3 [Rhizobiaceae bacterium]|nr:30S ribosomal protein S3 [Rhizobiaceae bacterium]
MGNKSSAIGLRLQINRTWDSRWFAEGQDYGRLLLEDLKIRKHIMKILPQAAISKVVIERPAKLCRISIYAARPGVIIGKKGSDIEKLKSILGKMTSSAVSLNIVEIRKPEIDARLVAQGIADQLERRIAFRRAMKRAVQAAMRLGAEGIRINCGGRLGGAEIARSEWYREGRVPLHTLRGNVDFAEAQAHTAYGVCGVKVWVFKGEILGHDPLAQDRLMMEAQTSGARPMRDDRR